VKYFVATFFELKNFRMLSETEKFIEREIGRVAQLGEMPPNDTAVDHQSAARFCTVALVGPY